MDQLVLPFLDKQGQRKRLYYASSFALLERKLIGDIRSIKDHDPLTPVFAVVPSGILAKYLRRKITGGAINFLNFKQLASKLAEEDLTAGGMVEIPHLGEELFARRTAEAIIDSESVFYPFIKSQGFLKIFMALLKDFRQGGFDGFPDTGEILRKMEQSRVPALSTEKLSVIFNLLEKFRESFKGKYYDVEDLIEQAAKRASAIPAKLGTDNIFIYGFHTFDHAQKKLVGEIIKYSNVTAFMPYNADSPLCRGMLEFYKKAGFESEMLSEESSASSIDAVKKYIFTGKKPEQVSKNDGCVKILSCTSLPEEAREVVREVVALADEGIPFDRMAVLVKNHAAYGSMLINAFDSAGIPVYYHERISADMLSAGRSLKLLINLLNSDFRRSPVMEFLASGNVKFDGILGDYEPSPARWNVFTMNAGIKEGYHSWKRSLENLKAYYDGKKENDDDESEAAAAAEASKELEKMLVFIGELNKDISSFSAADSWGAYAGKLITLFEKYIVEDGSTKSICSLLSGLERLGTLISRVEFETFKAFALEQLQRNLITLGKFQSGCINIFSPQSAFGLLFDAVIIPGMITGAYPQSAVENPLMLDFEREVFNGVFDWEGKLPLRGDLEAQEPLIFEFAARSCDKRLTLTFPRVNASKNSETVPSSYILEVAGILSAQEVYYGGLKDVPCYRDIPSRIYRKDPPDIFIDEAEYREYFVRDAKRNEDRAAIGSLTAYSAEFKKALEYHSGRLVNERFTGYDGKIGTCESLESCICDIFKAASAHKIEEYYFCPYKFFLKRLLSITPLEAADTRKSITALDRGDLYHKIFYSFYSKLLHENKLPLEAGLFDSYVEMIREIAKDTFDRFEESGMYGNYSSWFEQSIEMNESLEEFIEREMEPEHPGYTPDRLEFSFGLPDESGMINIPAAEIDIGGGEKIPFHGRIDRLDVAPDNTCVIIDYKTGASGGKVPDGLLQGGCQLQLALYLYTISQIIPEITGIEKSSAEYYYATKKGDFKKVRFSGEHLISRKDEIEKLVRSVPELAKDGIFIPYPIQLKPGVKPEEGAQEAIKCGSCDYIPVCSKDIEQIYRMKAEDKFIEKFLELKGIE